MSKLLSTLIAGLFAVSAFATDAPKAAAPDAKPAVETVAPAKAEVKKVHKHHKKTKAAAPTEAAAPAVPAAK